MQIRTIDLQNLLNRLKRATHQTDLILWQTQLGGKVVYRVKRKVGERIMDSPFSDRDYEGWELAMCLRFALRALKLSKAE